MEATLKFNLPEEQEDFEQAINGYKWSRVVWDMDQHLRSELKHNDKLSKEAYATLEETRDKLREFIQNQELSLK